MPATDAYWRNLKRMHIWFAVSAVALFAVTLWMMADDHAREYFDYQRNYYRLEALRAEAKINALQTEQFQKEVAALRSEVEAAREDLSAREDDIEALRDELSDAELAVSLAEDKLKLLRSQLSKIAADRDLAVRDEKPESVIRGYQERYEAKVAEIDAQQLRIEQLNKERDEIKNKLNRATQRLTDAQKRLEQKTRDVEMLRKTKREYQPEGWGRKVKRKIMEWPVLQGFNSHLHIRQDWLPDLPIKLGMTETARFDRCRTCHLGIDRIEPGNVPAYPHGHPVPEGEPTDEDLRSWVESGKYPHPYASHPNLDLYLTVNSPHPAPAQGGPDAFGCTTCHAGNGSGTSFQNAEHGPNHPHQAERWEEMYGYHANHYWEYPMRPNRFVESSCIKCHHHVEELGEHPEFGASAPKVFAGYRLIQQYGCFGCHEVHGYESGKPIGPDMRLEPNYTEAALQLRWLLKKREQDGRGPTATGISLKRVDNLLETVIRSPGESAEARSRLTRLIRADSEAKRKALTELAKQKMSADDRAQQKAAIQRRHLAARTAALVDQFKNVAHPGMYRKAGPSLRYIAHKVPMDFIPYWTEEPKRFRPTTRMPQFFKLSNLQDAHGGQLSAAELIAVARYLYDKSQPFEMLPLRKQAEPPNAERGRKYFETKGCLACHSHSGVEGIDSDFGPDLSLVAAKVKRDADNPEFSSWLYTWIRQPHRYHKRTRMPHLFLDLDSETVTVDGTEKQVHYDPAADITAFLLQESEKVQATRSEYEDRAEQLRRIAFTEVPLNANGEETLLSPLDYLVRLYLEKTLTRSQVDLFFRELRYPITDIAQIKGDEIELATGTHDGKPTPDEWRNLKLRYLGRRTISRYGCFGCHDIPGFERSRPIGTTLQDWGRKDRSQIAFEHIGEYLKHHGEPDGSATQDRARQAMVRAKEGSFESEDDEERELSVAFFYHSILHHEREGFVWQKLRQPRSYDYEKIQTKGYDERLRMPKFPLEEQQIEQIATFVLGLVAEPPPDKYLYRPSGAAHDRIQGERLLNKYNCTGCHMVELPEVTYWANLEKPPFASSGKNSTEELGYDLLLRMMPPRNVDGDVTKPGRDVFDDEATLTRFSFRGLPVFDADEDPTQQGLHYFHNWEHLDVGGNLIAPSDRSFRVPQRNLISVSSGRGGTFAEWLFGRQKEQAAQRVPIMTPKEANLARHQIPPVLYREGYRVQTPWLYQFLRSPHPIRKTTVLRMPRFNLSNTDARSLANYFAAVDNLPYPYQEIPQRRPEYLARQNEIYREYIDGKQHPDYLSQAWKMLVNPKFYCRTCHTVGGYEVQAAGSPDAIDAPNLKYAADRLRPDWMRLWMSNPKWVTPYTAMPVNFKPAKVPELRQFKESFGGVTAIQLQAARDALVNYHTLLERHKDTQFQYPADMMKDNKGKQNNNGKVDAAKPPPDNNPKPKPPKPKKKEPTKKAVRANQPSDKS